MLKHGCTFVHGTRVEGGHRQYTDTHTHTKYTPAFDFKKYGVPQLCISYEVVESSRRGAPRHPTTVLFTAVAMRTSLRSLKRGFQI